MTGKETCEYIVRALKTQDPNCSVTPEEIWHLSPTGELGHVFDLYAWARTVLDGLRGQLMNPADSALRDVVGEWPATLPDGWVALWRV